MKPWTLRDRAAQRKFAGMWFALDTVETIAAEFGVAPGTVSKWAQRLGLPGRQGEFLRRYWQQTREERKRRTPHPPKRRPVGRRRQPVIVQPEPDRVDTATLWRCPACGQLTPLAAGAAIPQRCPHTQQEAA